MSLKAVLEPCTFDSAASGAELDGARPDDLAGIPRPEFAVIYREHFQFVWRSLRLLGVSPESLEDALQDTFTVVSRQLAGFEGRSALSTWIFAIAQRVAANYRRMHRRKLLPLARLEQPVAGHEPAPDVALEAAQAARSIESFVAQLDEQRRALFILTLMEGVPAAEIAALEQTSVNTIYSRIRLLRLELKAFLDDREVSR